MRVCIICFSHTTGRSASEFEYCVTRATMGDLCIRTRTFLDVSGPELTSLTKSTCSEALCADNSEPIDAAGAQCLRCIEVICFAIIEMIVVGVVAAFQVL